MTTLGGEFFLKERSHVVGGRAQGTSLDRGLVPVEAEQLTSHLNRQSSATEANRGQERLPPAQAASHPAWQTTSQAAALGNTPRVGDATGSPSSQSPSNSANRLPNPAMASASSMSYGGVANGVPAAPHGYGKRQMAAPVVTRVYAVGSVSSSMPLAAASMAPDSMYGVLPSGRGSPVPHIPGYTGHMPAPPPNSVSSVQKYNMVVENHKSYIAGCTKRNV